MLKVAENLKCKYCRFVPIVAPEVKDLDGYVLCMKHRKDCKGVCEDFVNKFKEWEDERALQVSERSDR